MLKGLGCFKFCVTGFCIVALCHGREHGRDFHAFIAVEPQNYRRFLKHYHPGQMTGFKVFGHELARGWGVEPSIETMYEMEDMGVDFGVDEGFIDHLVSNFESSTTSLRHAIMGNMTGTRAHY